MNSTEDSLCLAGKPPRESQGIVDFAEGLREWLASLVGDDMGEIITVFTNQGVPFQEPLRPCPWVRLSVALECFVGLAAVSVVDCE